MGNAATGAPEVGQQRAGVGFEVAAGLAEADQQVFLEEGVGRSLPELCLGPRVEHDHFVVAVERLEILAERDVDSVGVVAMVVDGRHAAVGQGDRAADLAGKVGRSRC